ncbi:MAG: TPM domain-containing protein [Flavobacteriales bacterium]|jgi:uncharacterized membrane protein|nr:MAG: TPM domain-containing protein [Flavobacteriales bacterium]
MPTLAAEDLLTEAELKRVRLAIAAAEERTSGEIRVHMEDHIEEDVLDHAAFIFEELGMHRTRHRNGVLIYLSVADRKLAVIGDEGIDRRVPANFWNDVLGLLKLHLAAGRPADGLVEAVHTVGEKLSALFPREANDQDELPNDISFGSR